MRYAVIENATSLVDNVVEADAVFQIPDHSMVPGEQANIGDTYDGANFIPPPPPPQPPSFDTSPIMGGDIREIIGR